MGIDPTSILGDVPGRRFSSPASPSPDSIPKGFNLKRSADRLVDFLLHDGKVEKTEMFSDGVAGRVFRAMLVDKNTGALRAIRERVQDKFIQLGPDLPRIKEEMPDRFFFKSGSKEFMQMGGSSLLNPGDLSASIDSEDPDRLEMKIGSLLTLFAYFNPDDNETITIPVQINDEWKMVDYEIKRIKISSDEILSPIYAFGLTQINQPAAPPILLFRGTTYFQDSGFFSAVAADLPLPWNEVGEQLFESGRTAITNWINENSSQAAGADEEPKPKIQVYGHSLGGTLALHTGAEFGDRVEVFAYNPAGFMRLREAMNKIVGRIFCHERDAVSKFGRFPEAGRLTYHRVSSDHKKGRFNAHCKVMGFDEGTEVEEVPIADENRKISRYVLPILHRLGALLALPLIHIFATVFAIGKLIGSKNRTTLVSQYFKSKMTSLQSLWLIDFTNIVL